MSGDRVTAALAEIQAFAGAPDRTQKQTARYKELIGALVQAEDVRGLQRLTEHLLSQEVPALISRGVLAHLAQCVVQGLRERNNPETLREVAFHALEKGHTNSQAFEDADYTLRTQLFDVLQAEGSFKEAATVLAGLNLDSVGRTISDAEKADIYVKIAETYMQDDEAVDAEAFVNRASSLMEAVTDYWVQLRYRVTYARVLDANRKFLEAAMRYYELSQAQRREIPQHELLQLLGNSVTCAILGKAGPQRSRILGTLHKDERKNSLETLGTTYSAHAKVLEKMYMEQVLRRKEMAEFAECLQAHQKVKLADGFTILEKAIVEHNMVAASKVYDNIRFSELGNLLEIDAPKAEKVAARMIGEGRLKGSMDQVDGVLQFETDAGEVLAGWDEQIDAACKGVNAVLEDIEKAYPALVE